MKIFKFGGASVKNAEGVRNVAEILKLFPDDKIVVVVSAMDKTTNALEKVNAAYCNNSPEAVELLQHVKDFHQQVLNELFPDHGHSVYSKVNNFFTEIDWVLEDPPRGFDFSYDQIVATGELISTAIISSYLNESGIQNKWLDVRDVLRTDNTYREGKVDWEFSVDRIKEVIPPSIENKNNIVVVQGFIGSTSENYSTTLGREGSDYSAAILAYALDAESVTIWKDVPGVMNADPRFFPDAQKMEQLSYQDAIELAYYGASVIHPKTIKPLENKGIPLYVRSFMHPQSKGTAIGKDLATKPLIPSFIFKKNQVLLSLAARDFSFIAEDNLSDIFSAFADSGVKINLMQNSAISFSVCADYDEAKIPKLLEKLRDSYRVRYNENLELYTIRHYYPSTIEELSHGRELLLEQRSRTTAQLVMKEKEETN